MLITKAILLFSANDYFLLQSEGGLNGAAVKEIMCDANSPLNLQEILNGPNVAEVKTAVCKLNVSVLGAVGDEFRRQLQWPNVNEYQVTF